MPKILNVGGGAVPVPPQYAGWDVTLLDVDLDVHPDLWMDARQLRELEPHQFDVVYASHVLEHFYEHEIDGVLWGFYHVLTLDGYADIRVPDAKAVMLAVAEKGYELDDVLYTAPVGPIRVCDVLWGWQRQIQASGQPFYAHHVGFSRETLAKALQTARFEYILMGSMGYSLRAMAYKRKPEECDDGRREDAGEAGGTGEGKTGDETGLEGRAADARVSSLAACGVGAEPGI